MFVSWPREIVTGCGIVASSKNHMRMDISKRGHSMDNDMTYLVGSFILHSLCHEELEISQI